ncbi:hypothetical protein ACQ86N_25850 [Puia sp. P3]|uniref:hypothetical protein n=1 Tax=Puia sp. P3 TaxID=3423952 RepID=UPI003D67532F
MAIQLFSDGLCRYYEILCHYFEFEAESGGRTMVVSDTGRRLYCLLVLMGKHIDAIATTAALLKEWKVQIRNIEIQEIYN